MDTHGRHHPDEREPWFRTDPPADFADPVGQPAPGSWAPGADPLTGPLPPGGAELPPALAEPQEPAPSAHDGFAPNVLDAYQPGLVRQHAERLPRYVPPAHPTPESAPTSVPPTPSPSPSPRPAPSPRPSSAPPSPRPSSAPPAPASAPPAPPEPPPAAAGASFDSSTGALPTVAVPFRAPGDAGAPGHADRPGGLGDAEPGIPSSLAPMLSHEEATPAASRAPGSPPGSGAPQGPAQPTAAYPHVDSSRQRPPRPAGNPAVLVAVVLTALLAAAPSVLLLYRSALDSSAASASGVVSATLMLIGLPILAAGLYPLLSGGSAGVAPPGPEGWRAALRPPAAYLIVGLVLLLSAGLAAG